MNEPLDSGLVRDYTLMVFLAATGVLQIAAARGGLRGLLLLSSPRLSSLLGLALIVGAYAWFFSGGPRAISGAVGGLEGSQQFFFFLVGQAAAVLTTLVAVSLLRSSAFPPGTRSRFRGLSALKTSTYLQAIVSNLWWKGPPGGRGRRPRLSLGQWARR